MYLIQYNKQISSCIIYKYHVKTLSPKRVNKLENSWQLLEAKQKWEIYTLKI